MPRFGAGSACQARQRCMPRPTDPSTIWRASGRPPMARTNGDYKVGYGKPPKGTQFKPGQSGNPKGRPKGSKAIPTLVHDELKARVAVTEGGLTKRMSKGEAIVKRL